MQEVQVKKSGIVRHNNKTTNFTNDAKTPLARDWRQRAFAQFVKFVVDR